MSAPVPTPESLAMDCGLKCDMCSAAVNYGDDYVAHLALAHQITKSIPYFMDKALAVVKGEKRKAADVFTIEEETVNNEGSSLESDGFDKFELDLDTRSSLEKTIEKTMDDLFKPIKLILEGKVPLDAEELSNYMNEDEDSFVGNAEERLWQSFDNLKEVITNMEFPVELLQQLANRRKTNVDDEKLLNDKSEPLEELVADNNDIKTTHFKMPLSKLNETTDTEELIKHIPSPISWSPSLGNIPTNPLSPTNLLPVRSDKSDVSTASTTSSTGSGSGPVGAGGLTHFLCSVKPCDFSTTKQGIEERSALSHLMKVHKITSVDMKKAAPGTYKFRKVKGQKLV